MSGIPVVVVASGGVPVVAVQSKAPVMTVATNGLGLPVTVVTSNAPAFVIEGYTPTP